MNQTIKNLDEPGGDPGIGQDVDYDNIDWDGGGDLVGSDTGDTDADMGR